MTGTGPGQGHKGKAKAARQQSLPTPAHNTNTGETTPCPSCTKQANTNYTLYSVSGKIKVGIMGKAGCPVFYGRIASFAIYSMLP